MVTQNAQNKQQSIKIVAVSYETSQKSCNTSVAPLSCFLPYLTACWHQRSGTPSHISQDTSTMLSGNRLGHFYQTSAFTHFLKVPPCPPPEIAVAIWGQQDEQFTNLDSSHYSQRAQKKKLNRMTCEVSHNLLAFALVNSTGSALPLLSYVRKCMCVCCARRANTEAHIHKHNLVLNISSAKTILFQCRPEQKCNKQVKNLEEIWSNAELVT